MSLEINNEHSSYKACLLNLKCKNSITLLQRIREVIKIILETFKSLIFVTEFDTKEHTLTS